MAAGAQAGRNQGGEGGFESGPLGERADSPLAGAAAAAGGEPLGARDPIRHLNRCLGQAQPPSAQSPSAPAAPPHLALPPASPPAPSPIERSVRRPGDGVALPAADPLALAAGQAQRISLEAEIPEALFDGMRAFIQARPDWDQYSLVTSALAGFLFQHGWADGCVSEHYLNGLFRDAAA